MMHCLSFRNAFTAWRSVKNRPSAAASLRASRSAARFSTTSSASALDGFPIFTSHVLHRNLTRDPLVVESAQGCYLHLKSGRKIFDAAGGAAVTAVGHAHPRIVAAVQEQVAKLSFCHSSAYTTDTIEELARVLCRSAGMEKALFLTGGTEAVDSSIKLAYHYHVQRGEPQRTEFIARKRSYHGNSISALALGNDTLRGEIFRPILGTNLHHVSPAYAYRGKTDGESDESYVARLAQELEEEIVAIGSDRVAAFYAETVLGTTAGCVTAPPGYFKAIKAVLDRYGVLLVLDEIMCGLGRTGYMHAWQHEGVQPDIQCVAKTLGSGYAPMSAVMMNKRVADAFMQGSKPFVSGHTYQQHVLGSRVALEVLHVYEEEGLVEQCRNRGLLLEKLLRAKLGDHPNVGDIRGRGLFYSLEFVQDKSSKELFPNSANTAQLVWEECMRRDVAVFTTSIGGIMLAPPYTITEAEVEHVVDVVAEAVQAAIERAAAVAVKAV